MKIEEMRRIAEAAIEGPWSWSENRLRQGDVRGPDNKWVCDTGADEQATAAHIATFDPPTVLKLLAIVEALEWVRDRAFEVSAGTLFEHARDKLAALEATE